MNLVEKFAKIILTVASFVLTQGFVQPTFLRNKVSQSTEWDTPLVVDAYATWCGPCLLMAPEFEAAANELKGKVRFVKLDTDKEPEMSGRLNIMGLPTLLFLDQFKAGEESEGGDGQPQAVLKERLEGAIRKDSIVALCDYHFFGGSKPEEFSKYVTIGSNEYIV